MTKAMPGWDLFEVLLHLYETGSLSAAARVLGTSQPTVRRQLESLESQLGTKLFTRTTAGLHPTEAAVSALALAREMSLAAAALVRTVSDSTESTAGSVRITCSDVIGVEMLPPVLAELTRTHPRLDFELDLSNRDADVLRRSADIAIRMHRPTQVGLIARRAGLVDLGLFASPGYLAAHGTPVRIADLGRHMLIGQDRETSIRDALNDLSDDASGLHFQMRCDHDLAQLGMIGAGCGIGVCQVEIGRRRGLVRVLPAFGSELEMWLTMHEDLRAIRRFRLVFDHLAMRLARAGDGDATGNAMSDAGLIA